MMQYQGFGYSTLKSISDDRLEAIILTRPDRGDIYPLIQRARKLARMGKLKCYVQFRPDGAYIKNNGGWEKYEL